MSKKRLIPKLQLATSRNNSKKLVVVITKQFGDKIEMLTPTEEKSRGAQIGFRIKQSKKENPNIGFVNHARSNQIILRHVAENGLDNIRISTHYYNSEEEIEQCVSLLKTYAFG